MNQPVIEIKNLTKKFEDKVILSGVNLTVERGERIAIIGPSGCGKSTLLRLVMGLQKPDSGKILLDGVDVLTMDKQDLKTARLKFGILFQSAALFDSMTVEENVGFSPFENLKLPSSKVKQIVKEKLSLVEMEGYEKFMPSDLSGGQKKRIGLARALASNPEVLLYDEPTTGLDPILSTIIEDLIVKLNNQLSVTSIIVTHQHSTIFRTADKIYMMTKGQLLPPENPMTIVESENEVIREFIHGGREN